MLFKGVPTRFFRIELAGVLVDDMGRCAAGKEEYVLDEEVRLWIGADRIGSMCCVSTGVPAPREDGGSE